MTLKKNTNVDKEFVEHDPLTKTHFGTKRKIKVTIMEEPRIVSTKYTNNQALVIVKFGVETLCWWCNQRSMNGLIEKFGEEESNHVKKDITLFTTKQFVKGEERDVIYLDGTVLKKGS